MKKLWALLFLLVPIFGVWSFYWASQNGIWFPENISTFGGEIDHLFNVILGITGVTFVVTEVTLAWFLFKYQGQGKDGAKGAFVHGNHRLEIAWTIVPTLILIFITVYQYSSWKKIKVPSYFPTKEVFAEVTAGQFEWRFRYPGPDGQFMTNDDIHSLNELHVPINTDIRVNLTSRDVLHSFFLPNLRLKQDALPGLNVPVWFNAEKAGDWDLVCAELCGWGHYKMRGVLVVHKTDAEFQEWLTARKAEEERDQ